MKCGRRTKKNSKRKYNGSTSNTVHSCWLRAPTDHHQSSRCLTADHLMYSVLFVGPRRPRPAAAANFYSCPLVQHQTVMNAAGGIINDLTVKSLRSWTMRLRKNNRGQRESLATHTTSLIGLEWPAHFLHGSRDQWRFTVCLKAEETIFS